MSYSNNIKNRENPECDPISVLYTRYSCDVLAVYLAQLGILVMGDVEALHAIAEYNYDSYNKNSSSHLRNKKGCAYSINAAQPNVLGKKERKNIPSPNSPITIWHLLFLIIVNDNHRVVR